MGPIAVVLDHTAATTLHIHGLRFITIEPIDTTAALTATELLHAGHPWVAVPAIHAARLCADFPAGRFLLTLTPELYEGTGVQAPTSGPPGRRRHRPPAVAAAASHGQNIQISRPTHHRDTSRTYLAQVFSKPGGQHVVVERCGPAGLEDAAPA